MNSARPRSRPVVLIVVDGPTASEDGGDVLLSLGAGRPASTLGSRIDRAIREETLAADAAIRRIVSQAKDFGGRLHLIGLVSRGGVHSSLGHLFALIEIAKKARVRVVVHALLDGRDAPPGMAPRDIAELESNLAGGTGRIGTVGGRSWGMTGRNAAGRSPDRLHRFYRAILAAEVYRADSAIRGIEQSYEAGKTDEFVEPFVVFDYPGVSPVDVAIHFNLRPDGARDLTLAMAGATFDGFARKGGRAPFAGRYACLAACDPLLDVPTAFPQELHSNTLPELLARGGMTQFRCADAETFARVTRFFDGGRDEPFEGEVLGLIARAADSTSEGGPADTGSRVARKAEDAIRSGQYDFGLVHFSATQGSASAAHRAAGGRAVNSGVERVIDAARATGGAAIVVGGPGASHRVPIVYRSGVDPSGLVADGGRPCDVAPTVLDLIELPRPAEMVGHSLLEETHRQ